MKLEQLDNNNSTVLKMTTGVSWKDHNEVLFDDHTVLVFNNPEDSSIAAVTTTDDPFAQVTSANDISMFNSLKMEEIPLDLREQMDVADIDIHDRKKQEMQLMFESI